MKKKNLKCVFVCVNPGLVDSAFQNFSVFYRQQYATAYFGHLHQEVEPKKEGRGLLLTHRVGAAAANLTANKIILLKIHTIGSSRKVCGLLNSKLNSVFWGAGGGGGVCSVTV